MQRRNALVIAEHDTADLDSALRAAGFVVHRAGLRETLFSLQPVPLPVATVALVSAAYDRDEIRLLARHLECGGGGPLVLAFPRGGELATLAACLRDGLDVVAPPYLPEMLLRRLELHEEHAKLVVEIDLLTGQVARRAEEREQAIARTIQAEMLPPRLPEVRGWEIAARFSPAAAGGGDLYDTFPLGDDGHVGVVVADVCDHGVGSAMYVALLRTLVRRSAQMLPPSPHASLLESILRGVNDYIARLHCREGYFATVFAGIVVPGEGEVVYVNGGHHPPIVARRDGARDELPPTGPAVGVSASSRYEIGRVRLQPEDTLLAYTDGLAEARGPDGGYYTADALHEQLRRPAESVAGRLDGIDESVRAHIGDGEPSDDITLLALRRTSG